MNILDFNKDEFREYLISNIPIVSYMGIEIIEYMDDEVKIGAKLSKNINHKGTAFGGSINTLLTLTCWSMAFKHIKSIDSEAHLVIQESSVKFLKPIKEDFISSCLIAEEKKINNFKNFYIKKGKSRIDLESQITIDDEICAVFKGRFVAFK